MIKSKYNIASIRVIFVCFFMSMIALLNAQVLSEAMAMEELKKRGLTEQEVRTELLKRGVDIDQLDPNNPAALIEAEKTIREVISDLEQQKQIEKQAARIDSIKRDSVVPKKEVKEALEEIIESASPDPILPQVFGHHLFKGAGIKVYDSVNDQVPGENYIIGPGDQISISIWGLSDISYSTIVSNEGFINTKKSTHFCFWIDLGGSPFFNYTALAQYPYLSG